MSKGKIIALVLAALAVSGLLLFTACAGFLYFGFTNSDSIVSPRIDALFEAIETDEFAATYDTETTAELREATTAAQYAELGDSVREQLGPLQSRTLSGFNMRQHNADSLIKVTYNAEFEKANGTIEAQLKKEGELWKFVMFHVDSPALKQLVVKDLVCAACGERQDPSARFCPACGVATGKDNSEAEQNFDAETQGQLDL